MIENDNTKQNEVKDNVPYQFTASPLNLLYALDSDCFKMLNLLIQEESYWKSKGRLDVGYFFKSVNDLKEDMFMSNDQDVRLTLDALYVNGLIDIIPQGEQMKASKFRLNMEKITEIDKMSILDVKKFFPKIYRLKRGSKCSYVDRKGVGSIEPGVPKLSTNCTSDSTPKLYKLDNSNKIEKIDNSNIIDNKDKIENSNEIENNIIINDNIKVEVKVEVEVEVQSEEVGNNPYLFSESLIVDSNGKEIIDASTTKVVAQTIEQTKGNFINENTLMTKLKEDFNRLGRKDFYNSLESYSAGELEEISKMVPYLPMKMDDKERGEILFRTDIALKWKKTN